MVKHVCIILCVFFLCMCTSVKCNLKHLDCSNDFMWHIQKNEFISVYYPELAVIEVKNARKLKRWIDKSCTMPLKENSKLDHRILVQIIHNGNTKNYFMDCFGILAYEDTFYQANSEFLDFLCKKKEFRNCCAFCNH